MLFLGAGASYHFGIPTMSKFVDEILDSLPTNRNDWKNEINSVKCRLDDKGFRSDIEIILTALTILTDESRIQNYLIPVLGISVEITHNES